MVDLGFFYNLGKQAASLRKKTEYRTSGRNVKGADIEHALNVAGNSSQPTKGIFKWRSGTKTKG